MARTAIIADIHGNAVALRAALADIERKNIDRIVCLGDLAATGPEPLEAIAEIRRRAVPTIRGNADDEVLDPPNPQGTDEPLSSILEISEWTGAILGEPDRELLSELPFSLDLDLDNGQTALLVHGSPRSFDETIYSATDVESLDAMTAEADAAILVCGHTHIQMLRRHRHLLIVNPGAVGLTYHPVPPAEDIHNVAWAEYGVIDASSTALGVEFYRVPYDIEELLASVEASDMPHGEWWSNLWRPAPLMTG